MKILSIKTINRLLILCFLCLVICQQSFSQTQKSPIVIPLKNGKSLSIQPCTDQILRIRISSSADFPETLMERYHILKTDWESVPFTSSSKVDGSQTIQTKSLQVIFNKKTGDLSINNAKGESVINNIHLLDENQSVGTDLRKSIEQYFGKVKHGGGIIGDVQFTGKAADSLKQQPTTHSSILELSLLPDDRIYGGGATSRENIQHRGEVLRMWATYQKTEIPMPFVMSSNGWGIFNNTTSLNYFDIGRFQKDKLFVYNTDGNVDFYLMIGPSMDEVLNEYVSITGKPFLLPKWAYGLSFAGNTMEDQMELMNDAVRFRDEKIPCDLFSLEPQWMAKNYDFSTSKNWNLDKFAAEPFWEVNKYPKYEAHTLFIAKLHNLGFKLALWLCIDHDLTVEEEDHWAEKNGRPQSGQEHWFPHLTKFMDQGVDGFKLDPGRTLDEHPDRKYYNGSTDKQMHNLNQVLLPKQMYTVFREHKGIRPFQHYCGGYAGSQHWGASTSGDNGGGKVALFDQLNLGLSGFVNTSADVMEGIDNNNAGLHLGFFLPWVQINSWYSLHHPWYLKPIEKECFRFYAQLRNSLSPYIYSAALQGSQTGMPIVRAMPLVFPNDQKVDNMIYQFMFGDNLLVGVFSDSIYLPKGNWINYWNDQKVSGGQFIHSKIPANRGGCLFIKAGAIIPYQKPMQYIGEFPVDTLIVKVYPENQSAYTLWEDDGLTFDYEKNEIATTRFECSKSEGLTTFTILPCKGHYAGIHESRTYQLEIELPHKPEKVMVNKKLTEDWKYDPSGKVIMNIFQSNRTDQQIVEFNVN